MISECDVNSILDLIELTFEDGKPILLSDREKIREALEEIIAEHARDYLPEPEEYSWLNRL